ncbi:hypothetical protein GCM10012275_39650 [Longimycelium tulufanense]|uniref:Uncharacterized protein n=1 Tax=Longimycelium tulufanense TaxID=907463 RepID=A0A8J3CAI5_9PSEU|nr:hypothetical protein [Longimycelium tulufanense]GGM65185.1 hypothetical protein GCM10012275_39650 [Longimycelium tulufanense]
MTSYRNRRTGQVHEPEPGSWMAHRLAGLPDVWEPVEPAPARPARTARKADWVDYAVARGYTRADAESLSREDLARLFDADDEG